MSVGLAALICHFVTKRIFLTTFVFSYAAIGFAAVLLYDDIITKREKAWL